MRRHVAFSWPALVLACAAMHATGGCNDVLDIREPSEQVLGGDEAGEPLPDAGEPAPDAGEVDAASPGKPPAQLDAGLDAGDPDAASPTEPTEPMDAGSVDDGDDAGD